MQLKLYGFCFALLCNFFANETIQCMASTKPKTEKRSQNSYIALNTSGYDQEIAAIKKAGLAEQQAYEAYGKAKEDAANAALRELQLLQKEYNEGADAIFAEKKKTREDAALLQDKYKQLPADQILSGVSSGRKAAGYFAAFANGFSGRESNPVNQISDNIRNTQQQNFNNEQENIKLTENLTSQDLKIQNDILQHNADLVKLHYEMALVSAEAQFTKDLGTVAIEKANTAAARIYQKILNTEAQNRIRNKKFRRQYVQQQNLNENLMPNEPSLTPKILKLTPDL